MYPVLLCSTHMLSIVSLVPWADVRLLQWKRRNPEGYTWWRHQMETFSALLAICAGNSPFTGEFPAQRPVTWSFDVFFDQRMNIRLCKQWWSWWFEMPSRSLWRHCNEEIDRYQAAAKRNKVRIECIFFFINYTSKLSEDIAHKSQQWNHVY